MAIKGNVHSLMHVSGKWPLWEMAFGGNGTHLSASPLTNGEYRATHWFEINDPQFKVLFDIVTETKFSNDLGFCSEFLHTGRLESFHSMKLQFLPKITSFPMETNIVMTMLTALQNTLCFGPDNVTAKYMTFKYSRAAIG